ncbi:hypothetical protein RYX36_000192 [Vicia faba]
MFNSILILVPIIHALMFTFDNSMRFTLKSVEPKCISEDIKGNAMTVSNYSIVNLDEGFPIIDSHKIIIRSLIKALYEEDAPENSNGDEKEGHREDEEDVDAGDDRDMKTNGRDDN